MTALFDFRQTFLRKHLARELRETAEVLALEELNKIKGACLTIRDFFYRGLPEDSLYIPVPVLPLGDEVGGLPARYFAKRRPKDQGVPIFDLTYALDALRECDIPGGIYLRSRSGAGKTVAGLAALCDCFFGPGPQGVQTHDGPRLAGFLPCRLRTGNVFKGVRDRFARFKSDKKRQSWFDKQVRAAGSGFIEDMLLATADWTGEGRKSSLQEWLKAGPPLLIFVDLNAMGEVERRLTAASLVKFQEESAAAGHRVVVTYRSATLDAVHTTLSGCRLLHLFDLEPLTPWQAAEYLRTYRRKAAKRSGTPVSEAALDEEATALRQFIEDHVTDDESLVSTPLLMHLVTLISGTELAQGKVRTLSNLYDRVVHRFFEQDFCRTLTGEVPRLFADGAPGGPEGNFVTAMCRAALAILAGGESNTRLTGDDPTTAKDVLDQLWELPDVPRLWSGGPRWHPTTEWWLKDGPYYGPKAVGFDEAHRKELFRRTLLHEDGGSFRFLHDSFIYYFAALAVRGYCRASWNHARNDIEGESHPWYEHTAARLHETPRAWASAAEFLGGMLQPGEMSDLAFRMLIAAPKDGWPTVLIRLLGGRRQEPEDAVIADIDYALHHKEGMVERVPAALRTEVYHYLRDGAHDVSCRAFVERLERAGGCAWLYSVKRTWWPTPVMRAHRGRVTSVGLMPDGCVVSGSEDGRVLLWNPVRRRVRTLITHVCTVQDVAVSRDGTTVVSGGDDGSVRRWTWEGGEEREPLITHETGVCAVALSGDGATVVWGGGRTVRRWTQEGGEEAQPLATYVAWVTSVALSSDGAIVVSGGNDTAIWRCTRKSNEAPEPIVTNMGWVHAVAVRSDGDTVVWGGKYNRVGRWTRQGGEELTPLIKHEVGSLWKVHAVGLSDDGATVVSGGDDSAVRRWTRQGGEEPQPVITHEGAVLAVAVSGDGDTIVSGGIDKAVRRWTWHGRDQSGPLVIHEGPVWAVAVSSDGATVVSWGVQDGEVRRWTREGGEESEPILVQLWTRTSSPGLSGEGRVGAVALGGDSRTVVATACSVDCHNWVQYWTRECGAEREPIITHGRGGNLTPVALSNDGATVVSGYGQIVRRWTRQAGEEREPIITHRGIVRMAARDGEEPEPYYFPEGNVCAVAVNGDGATVVSGSNVVRRWTRQGGEEREPIITNGKTVWAVAVSGDGATVVSGGEDREVRRWTQEGGEESEPIITHEGTVRAVALSDDGATVVSGGEDCTVQCYRHGQGVVCAFLFNSGVPCLGLADPVGRIVAGLVNGEVLILDLRNFPPDPPA